MSEKVNSRRQQILELLLENRAGLSIDEISSVLNISRNAVQQHLTVLEKDGYIQIGELNKTLGRPVRSFVLTEAGFNSFPRKYAWFSELILSDLKEAMGSEAFQRYMQKLAFQLSQNLLPQFEGKSLDERIDNLLSIMNELGFKVDDIQDSDNSERIIKACNCIYHEVAQKHEEVCQFDRTLISSLLGKEIEQVECIAKKGYACCFKIINK